MVENIQSQYFTITFPRKTISGKNIGMYQNYNDFVENTLKKENYEYCWKKEYYNELLYVIKKK